MTSKDIPFSKSYQVDDPAKLKSKMLNWLKRFSIFCLLDNHDHPFLPHRYDLVAGAGSLSMIRAGEDDFDKIDTFLKPGQWTFGHVSYELGAEWNGINRSKKDPSGFPLFFFFVPEHILVLKKNLLTILSVDPDRIFSEIGSSLELADGNPPVSLSPRFSREAYMEKIRLLQAHIQRGDCYEINFCQEFFATNASVDPYQLYSELSAQSPNPFGGFYRVHESYLACASPERFLYREGDHIYCQPMKGTAGRAADPAADMRSKEELYTSAKDRSENVMVVDLVRNDLSKFCKDASVEVEELYGIYSFPNVHQMVSTVKGRLGTNVYFSHIIRSTFPMGSMTGAPKKRVMELIQEYEPAARGIFSGTLGYVDPSGNFDLNVVIRSIMYNSETGYLSYQVGSGITIYSDAGKEWEECLLKGRVIKKVLTGDQHF